MNFASLRARLKRFDSTHTYIAIDAAMVTAWVRWAPSVAAHIIFAMIWLLVALDMFEFYIRKISRKGRMLTEAGLL